ncbi:MAG TPA: type II toxin-antitoxin system RelE/ParE family toxin [Candidatus Eisenbacteria bacterium]|nr:type II toxin-antitoxin system RelE/ParE family toxin [Candidatus Eisenbacteria bacterium]
MRQLRGKLRELRFRVGREERRTSYFIAAGRRIVLLSVFRKTKPRETAQIDCAEGAMKRCVSESHTAE